MGDHARCVLTCWVQYSSSRQEVGWQWTVKNYWTSWWDKHFSCWVVSECSWWPIENHGCPLHHGRILGGVFSDELQSQLLKMPDLTRQATDNYCRTSRSTSLTHQKLLVPNVHFTLLETSRLKKGQLLASCKCCGNKHPFTQSSRCPAFPWKKCNKCKKVCKDLSAEG